jgi:hypothetical protein
MLKNIPSWIVLVFVVLVICILVAPRLLSMSEPLAVQAGVTVISVLVVTVCVIYSFTITGTAVKTAPIFAANIAEFMTAFTPIYS